MVRLYGQLDWRALEHSFQKLGERHEILRTSFSLVDEQPVQVIAPEGHIPLQFMQLTTRPLAEPDPVVQHIAQAAMERPFDLATGPLLRVYVIQLQSDHYVLLLALHHIITDGWSSAILVRELTTLYEACVEGRTAQLPPLPIQYADYAVEQQEWLQNDTWQAQLDYWKTQLSGAPPVLNLPTDYSRPIVPSYRGAQVAVQLSTTLTSRLHSLSRQTDTTLFMTVLAGFSFLLSRYSQQDEVVVGTPIAGRTRVEQEALIGVFVNTLLLRTSLGPNPTCFEFLVQIRETTLAAYEHQDVPFEQVVELLQPERSLSHSPLFQVMLVLQNTPVPSIELAKLQVAPLDLALASSKFDLTLTLMETSEGVQGWFTYATDLFEEATIVRLAQHYKQLLYGLVTTPGAPILSLPLLTLQEQRQLLIDWNATQTCYPENETLPILLTQQARVTPDAVAVVYDDQHLTYNELDRRTNQLAWYLHQYDLGPGQSVGICLERSIELVLAVVAVLKAGAAYIPLDPTYPYERLIFMLHDSQTSMLITQRDLLAELPNFSGNLLYLDIDWLRIESQSEHCPAQQVVPYNIAYIIYTSGSTGQPKGLFTYCCCLCELHMLCWCFLSKEVVMQCTRCGSTHYRKNGSSHGVQR